ncbi:MAG: lamin tail domain-containing protein [Nanoarchaeota archaeon]|nr:lamin tail domain-containing protein [Nanoarchaeota archaeon]
MNICEATILINEIHANPIEDESLNEWIELYNNESQSVNVSGWFIGDELENDTLEGGLFLGRGTIIPPQGFAIITDDSTRVYNNFDVEINAIKLYVNDGAIGNGLKNSGETIKLFSTNKELIHNITYDETIKGLSHARFNTSFSPANATPGLPNDGSKIETPSTGCDWYLEILMNKTLFEPTDEFEWQLRAKKQYGNKTITSATASIRDLTGNYVKSYTPWTNHTTTSRKSSSKYSPSLQKGKSYVLTAQVTTECEDQEPASNRLERIFTLLDTPLANTSSIAIEQIYDLGSDEVASFGQTIRAKVNVYKGDTSKEVVALWIEDENHRITKQSKVYLPDKFTNYEITLPIQIKPNCNLEYESDTYVLKAQGLSAETTFTIEVAGIEDSICPKESIAQQQPDLLVNIAEYPSEVKSTDTIETKIYLENNDNRHHNLMMWTYLFKGSNTFSGERKENLQEVFIEKRGTKEKIFKNKITNIPSGEYNFMLRYTVDGSEKEKRVLRTIKVIGEIEETTLIASSQEREDLILTTSNTQSENIPITGNFITVYESTTFKTKQLGVYFFAALITLYAILLTWKR